MCVCNFTSWSDSHGYRHIHTALSESELGRSGRKAPEGRDDMARHGTAPIPVTTISGMSRMVPCDAVLRWPRLNCSRAAKTHTQSCVHRHADCTHTPTLASCWTRHVRDVLHKAACIQEQTCRHAMRQK